MCSREWHAVEHLSFLRNDRFAHCKTACITNNELGYVIQDIEAVYKTLHVPPSHITKMRSIISEPIVESSIVQKIEYYKEKWLKESEHYVQVKEDIGHLQTDVKEIKEKDIPEIKDNFKEVEKALMESKEHQDEFKHKQQAIENEMHLTVASVSTLEDKYEAMQGQTSGQLDSLKSRQSTLEDKQSLQEQTLTLHGTQLADNSEKIAQTSNEISTLRCQQSQIASRVSHTADFVRTISSEQNQQMIKVGDKLASLETTERQLSEEVAQSGEIIRQLSVEQGKLTENVTVLYKDIEDVKVNVSQVKEEVELLKHKGPSSKLSISHFESDITYYNDQYHVGTRQWLLDEIFSWISQPPRNINQPNFCMIVSNPGMGKSVVASKVLSLVRESGILAGWFFFQHHMGRRSNPRMLVQTLCHQMMSTIEGYSALIEEDLADMDIASHTLFELFAYLIREPLYRLPLEYDRMVIVIDALDECDFESRPDLLKLLLREFIKLPKWMNIILTSRPDQKILQTLKRIKRIIEILPDDPRNLDDIRLFLHDFLKEKMSANEFESGVQLLVTKSEGMFLYFHYAIDTLEGRKIISLQELHSLLPDGIDDYYEHNFKRLFNELGREKYQKFLQGVLASRSDFPQRFVGPLLDLNPQEAIKVVSLVSPLLPIHNECINVFHKSVRDWLLDEELAGDYAVDPMEGHKHLAYLCHSKLQDIKANFSSSTSLSEQVNQYVILNVIHHMCTCIDPLSCHQLISVVEDLQFLYLRLLFSHGSTEGLLEDLAETQKALAKHKQLRQRTQDVYLFIQRCAHLLNGKPYLVFQCALNEPDMFSKRLGIQRFLANPLQAFPDLKVLLQVVNKSQHFSSSLITFTCDDDITSCITSPAGPEACDMQ